MRFVVEALVIRKFVEEPVARTKEPVEVPFRLFKVVTVPLGIAGELFPCVVVAAVARACKSVVAAAVVVFRIASAVLDELLLREIRQVNQFAIEESVHNGIEVHRADAGQDLTIQVLKGPCDIAIDWIDEGLKELPCGFLGWCRNVRPGWVQKG